MKRGDGKYPGLGVPRQDGSWVLETGRMLLDDSITNTVRFIVRHLNDLDKWSRTESTVTKYLETPSPVETGADLGCTTIKMGEVDYHVHGIVHGTSPLSSPSKRLRKLIQESARYYAGPIGHNLLCEERFSRYWRLAQNTDIDDIANTLSASEQVRWIADKWETWRGRIVPESSESRRRISCAVSEAIERALQDEQWLGAVRDLYEELPYPLILADEPSELNGFYIDLARSRYMAEYMVAYAQLCGISNLHALVGLGHEREVVYFIANPDATLAQCITALGGAKVPWEAREAATRS
jgi:hypothetical protein